MPPEYYEDEEIDYALKEEDRINEILDDMSISNSYNKEKQLNRTEMTPLEVRDYLKKKVIKDAKIKTNQLKGYKSQVSKKYNQGEYNQAEKTVKNKQIDDAKVVLNQKLNYYENKLKTIKGSGIGKRKQRGDNVIFFNNPKKLLEKLERIVGEIMAGNTSIKLRNTGVAKFDILLKTSAMNKAQHEKLYKIFFKIVK